MQYNEFVEELKKYVPEICGLEVVCDDEQRIYDICAIVTDFSDYEKMIDAFAQNKNNCRKKFLQEIMGENGAARDAKKNLSKVDEKAIGHACTKRNSLCDAACRGANKINTFKINGVSTHLESSTTNSIEKCGRQQKNANIFEKNCNSTPEERRIVLKSQVDGARDALGNQSLELSQHVLHKNDDIAYWLADLIKKTEASEERRILPVEPETRIEKASEERRILPVELETRIERASEGRREENRVQHRETQSQKERFEYRGDDNKRYTRASNIRMGLLVLGALIGLLICVILLSFSKDLSGEAVGLISAVSGIFGSCLKDIYSFEFGSSRGSKDKDRFGRNIIC